MSSCPNRAASIKGVFPSSSVALTSTFGETSSVLTVSALPARTARPFREYDRRA
jgi:hypothetical protein